MRRPHEADAEAGCNDRDVEEEEGGKEDEGEEDEGEEDKGTYTAVSAAAVIAGELVWSGQSSFSFRDGEVHFPALAAAAAALVVASVCISSTSIAVTRTGAQGQAGDENRSAGTLQREAKETRTGRDEVHLPRSRHSKHNACPNVQNSSAETRL